MTYGFELEIHRLLKDSDDLVVVADELLKRWERGELSWKDQESASEFLLAAGFTSAFFQQVAKAIKSSQKIPWSCLLEGFGRVGARLTKEEIDQILVGAAEEEALSDISRSRALDSQDPRFSKIRLSIRDEKRAKAVVAPIAVAPRPTRSPSGTIVSDRTRPNIQNIRVQRVTLEEWARSKEETNTEAEETNLEISKQLIAKSREHPMSAYDIAISLQFMNLPNEALRALKYSPARPGVPWLELDLLLETERYVEVLAKADSIEKKYSKNPEASFSAVYAKSIALFGLGRKLEAIIHLEGIVKVRPNYRSALSLLMKWKAESQ
jgi:hypothetical protein